MILSVALAVYLGATKPEDRCVAFDNARAQLYKEKGARLFLAYVDRNISEYEISPLKCDGDVVVVIAATGLDARIGDIWTITFHDADKSVTIRPGM